MRTASAKPPYNKRVNNARVACSTRKEQCSLLACYAQR